MNGRYPMPAIIAMGLIVVNILAWFVMVSTRRLQSLSIAFGLFDSRHWGDVVLCCLGLALLLPLQA